LPGGRCNPQALLCARALIGAHIGARGINSRRARRQTFARPFTGRGRPRVRSRVLFGGTPFVTDVPARECKARARDRATLRLAAKCREARTPNYLGVWPFLYIYTRVRKYIREPGFNLDKVKARKVYK
jgi:hypothetical protein